MDFEHITEAHETSFGKQSALTHLRYQVLQGESMGVIAMYERAALDAGATLSETEFTITTARKGKG